MVQPPKNAAYEANPKVVLNSEWRSSNSQPLLPDLHNIENFTLSDINVIKKIAQFISKKGNPLDPSVKDAVIGKLDNQIKEIKKDTSGIINWFRYLFSKNQWKQKQELAYCSEELKNLIQNKPIEPNVGEPEDPSSSNNSSPSESPNSSGPPSPVPGPVPGLNDGQAEGAPPPPPPANGFAPPPPPPPGAPGGPPPPPPFGAAPKPKAPEKFFRDEPKEPDFDDKVDAKSAKEVLAAQMLQIQDYLEAKKNVLGIVPPSKESPKTSPRAKNLDSRNSDLAAVSGKISEAGDQTYAEILGEAETIAARRTRSSSRSTPLKSKASSTPAKTPSNTPAKTPAKAKSEDILNEIKISLLMLFVKDPNQLVEKVKTGTIAEKVKLIELLKEKLKGFEEVQKERLAILNLARKKVEAFSQKGDVLMPIQLDKKDENPTMVRFYEKDEDFFRENEKRKADGNDLIPDSFRKMVMVDYYAKELAQAEQDHNVVMGQMGQIEGILKSLENENNNGIPFSSDVAKIFKDKLDTLRKWERALQNRKSKLEEKEKPVQVQQAKKEPVKPKKEKEGFDKLNEDTNFKIAQRTPAGVAQLLYFKDKK